MADVFVSYSRKDQTIVRQLVDALSGHGKEAWVDWEGIPPTADWLEEIYTAIEESGSFLFVISPDSAASEVCLKEVTHAEELGKRIVPVTARSVDPSALPPAISRRNWIALGDGRAFDESVATLIQALETDLEWLREHTRWLGKAREWERHDRDSSFLLRGAELRAAEAWLTTPQAAEKEPPATPLQNEYVLTSRQGATRRQRAFVVAVSIALLVTIVLAVAALLQRNRAISERKTAESELLASISRQRADKSLDTGLLLAVAAYDTKTTSAARDALLAGVQRTESMERMTRFKYVDPAKFAVSGDGRVVATATPDGIEVHRLEGGAEPVTIAAKEVQSLALDESGSRLAAVEGPQTNGRLVIRDISVPGGVARRPTPPALRRALFVSFAPRGLRLAVGTLDGYVFVLDLESGNVTRVVAGAGAPIHILAFDPTGTLLAAGSPVGTHAIDVRGEPRYQGLAQEPDFPTSMALADSETLFLVIGSELVVVDPRTRRETCPRVPGVSHVYVDPGGRIVAADESGAIRIVNEPCGRAEHVLRGHGTAVSLLSSGRAPGQLLSIDASGVAILWDTDGAQLISRRSTGMQLTTDIAAGWRDGEVIVAADAGVARVGSSTSIARLEGSPAGATMLATAPEESTEESTLAAAGRPAALWTGSRYERSDVMGATAGLSVALSRDGGLLALGQTGGKVDVWDLESDGHLGASSTGGQGSVTALALDGDGRIAAGDNAGRLVTWDGDDGEPTVLRPNGTAIEALAFSPDDRLLASASGAEITLWDRGEIEPVRLPQTHPAAVNDLAFTLSGELISADDSGVILVWDVRTGRVLGEALRTGMESIEGIDVDPSGSLIAVGGAGTMFRLDPSLWDVEAARERICAFAGRPLSEGEWSEAVPGLEPRSTC